MINQENTLNEDQLAREINRKIVQLCQLIDVLSCEQAKQLIVEMERLNSQMDPKAKETQLLKQAINEYKMGVVKYFKLDLGQTPDSEKC